MNRKNMRRISTLVTAQTAYNAEKLRVICGYKSIGQVFDKLVREKNAVAPYGFGRIEKKRRF